MLLWSGVASALAGLLHVAIPIGGPSWYAFFGAPRRLVEAARLGDPRAALTCAAIACILFVFAAYAFSGSGVIPKLPLLKPALAFMAAVFLVRGIAFVPAILIAPSWMGHHFDYRHVDAFVVVTSLVCIAIGLG
jgi:hypothetical protein